MALQHSPSSSTIQLSIWPVLQNIVEPKFWASVGILALTLTGGTFQSVQAFETNVPDVNTVDTSQSVSIPPLGLQPQNALSNHPGTRGIIVHYAELQT